MRIPDFSTLWGSLKSVVLSIPKILSRHKRQFLFLGASLGLVLMLALILGLVSLAVLRNRRASVVDPDMAPGYSLEGARVLRDLYMPGPAVGETPFPLAFEPDPGYTDPGALKLHNDMSRIDISDLRARRKAELEAIYNALD
jgi:hypothetical protein